MLHCYFHGLPYFRCFPFLASVRYWEVHYLTSIFSPVVHTSVVFYTSLHLRLTHEIIEWPKKLSPQSLMPVCLTLYYPPSWSFAFSRPVLLAVAPSGPGSLRTLQSRKPYLTMLEQWKWSIAQSGLPYFISHSLGGRSPLAHSRGWLAPSAPVCSGHHYSRWNTRSAKEESSALVSTTSAASSWPSSNIHLYGMQSSEDDDAIPSAASMTKYRTSWGVQAGVCLVCRGLGGIIPQHLICMANGFIFSLMVITNIVFQLELRSHYSATLRRDHSSREHRTLITTEGHWSPPKRVAGPSAISPSLLQPLGGWNLAKSYAWISRWLWPGIEAILFKISW